MPRQIENPATPSEYVDGLRSLGARNSYINSDDVTVTVTESGNPAYRVKGVDTHLPGPVRCLVVAAIFAAGMGTGAVLIGGPEPATVETATSPTVSPSPTSGRTKPAPAPKPSMPAACQRALDGTAKYLDSAARISDAGSQQHDILSEAYTAIIARDWRKLNELAERQNAMERELVGDKGEVLPKQPSLMKDLATCRSQLS